MNVFSKAIIGWLSWLAVALGCLSAISAISNISDIGLSGFISDMIGFYRGMTAPLYKALSQVNFPFTLSRLTFDLATLYFVLVSASFRATVIPLFKNKYFHSEKYADAKILKKIIFSDNLEENFPKDMIMARLVRPGVYEAEIYDFRSDLFTWAKHISLSFTLWPVITMYPLRKAKWSIKYLSKKEEALDESDNPLFAKYKDGSFVSRSALMLAKDRIKLAIQVLCLPIAIILFFVLANFIPI